MNELVLHGTMRGKFIELDREPTLPAGQPVRLIVIPEDASAEPTGDQRLESLRRAAGAWSNDDPDGLEDFLKWNREQRKRPRRELSE